MVERMGSTACPSKSAVTRASRSLGLGAVRDSAPRTHRTQPPPQSTWAMGYDGEAGEKDEDAEMRAADEVLSAWIHRQRQRLHRGGNGRVGPLQEQECAKAELSVGRCLRSVRVPPSKHSTTSTTKPSPVSAVHFLPSLAWSRRHLIHIGTTGIEDRTRHPEDDSPPPRRAVGLPGASHLHHHHLLRRQSRDKTIDSTSITCSALLAPSTTA